MAFTSIAALVGGQAVTAGLVLGAIAEVGLAMSVVGAVTGNKGLTKLGGVLGLVGGIGGLVNGAVSGGAAAAGTVESIESAASMADAAYGGAAGMEGAQLAGIEAMGGEGLQASMSAFEATDLAGIVDEASNAAFGVLDPAASAVQPAGSQSLTNALDTTAAEQASGAARAQEAFQNIQQTPDPLADATSLTDTKDLAKPPDPKGMYSPAADSQAAYAAMPNQGMDPKSWFSNILDWTKKNDRLASSLLTLGAGGLSGMGQMQQAKMQQEANNMRFQYGNQVADYRGRQPNTTALIGARR